MSDTLSQDTQQLPVKRVVKRPTKQATKNQVLTNNHDVKESNEMDASKVSKPSSVSLPVDTNLFKSSSSISKMSDNFVFIDNIYRSRMTLLDILESRGYDVTKFRKFSPAEATAAAGALQGLSFKVTKKDDPTRVCEVRYDSISRQKLDKYFNYIGDDVSENTEVIIMLEGGVADAHHAAALKEFMKMKENPSEDGKMERRKLRVSFFSIYMLVINPLHHVLVPKHEIVPESEHKELMARLHVTAKSKFPEIKFHVDPIARCIGAIPGDIVKITRPSQSSGEAIIYRVCAP